MSSDFKYAGFITYSHEDEEKASWLREKTWRNSLYPRAWLVKKVNLAKSLHGSIQSSATDELPGSAQLGPVIEQALADSSHLIVLCSPNAVKSKWVNEEIRLFQKNG